MDRLVRRVLWRLAESRTVVTHCLREVLYRQSGDEAWESLSQFKRQGAFCRRLDHVSPPSFRPVWLRWVVSLPSNILRFLLKLFLGTLPTGNKWISLGYNTEGTCPLCSQVLETSNHLFRVCQGLEGEFLRNLSHANGHFIFVVWTRVVSMGPSHSSHTILFLSSLWIPGPSSILAWGSCLAGHIITPSMTLISRTTRLLPSTGAGCCAAPNSRP